MNRRTLMNYAYRQALTAMPAEDANRILSPHPPPASSMATFNDVVGQLAQPDDDEKKHRQRHDKREWPATGTFLPSEYYGAIYTAGIIPARKRLKSGKPSSIAGNDQEEE